MIETLRGLEAKATPAPWWWEDWENDNGDDPATLVARPETREGGPSKMFPDLANPILSDQDSGYLTEPNRLLIAAMRNALPDLLARLASLSTERARMLREMAEQEGELSDAEADNARLTSELDRVRGRIEAAYTEGWRDGHEIAKDRYCHNDKAAWDRSRVDDWNASDTKRALGPTPDVTTRREG